MKRRERRSPITNPQCKLLRVMVFNGGRIDQGDLKLREGDGRVVRYDHRSLLVLIKYKLVWVDPKKMKHWQPTKGGVAYARVPLRSRLNQAMAAKGLAELRVDPIRTDVTVGETTPEFKARYREAENDPTMMPPAAFRDGEMILWRGRDVESLTRDELIEAVKRLIRSTQKEHQEHTRQLGVLSELGQARRL